MTTQSINRMTSSIYISALLLTSSIVVSANATAAAVDQAQVSPTRHGVSSRRQQLQRLLKRFNTNKKDNRIP